MNRFDIVGDWLNSVAYSQSQSKATEDQYKRVWSEFSSSIRLTAEQILADYAASDDRSFKRKYAQHRSITIDRQRKRRHEENDDKAATACGLHESSPPQKRR
jgi:hypothetical protein